VASKSHAVIRSAVGLPPEGIGALLVLDRLLDMARTAINVFADAACTVIVAKLEGEKDVLTNASPATQTTPASTT
jgi:Na+/H+-dicarboxylate symporter